jgi:anaerobic selenocysteine-containing dehydrogenase
VRYDTPAGPRAECIAPRPGTDVALMLALARGLNADGMADIGFLERYTVGFARSPSTCAAKQTELSRIPRGLRDHWSAGGPHQGTRARDDRRPHHCDGQLSPDGTS